MKNFSVLTLAVLLPLSFATAAKADWASQGTITGPYGNTVDIQGSGSCDSATQSCSRSKTWTGPDGRKTTKNVTVQQVAPGVFERNATTVGPNGRVYNRKSTFTRY